MQLPRGTGPSGWPSVASGPGWGSQGAHTGAPFPRGWQGAAAAADTPQGCPLVGVRNPYRCAGPEGSTPPLCPAARGSGGAFSNNHQGRDQCLRRGPSLACHSSGDRGSDRLPGRARDPGASSSSDRRGQPHGRGREQARPYIVARGGSGATLDLRVTAAPAGLCHRGVPASDHMGRGPGGHRCPVSPQAFGH